MPGLVIVIKIITITVSKYDLITLFIALSTISRRAIFIFLFGSILIYYCLICISNMHEISGKYEQGGSKEDFDVKKLSISIPANAVMNVIIPYTAVISCGRDLISRGNRRETNRCLQSSCR